MFMQSVPFEIFVGSISVIGVLTGYIWNGLHKRIEDIEKEQQSCPFPNVKSELAALRSDIKWIKAILMDKL